jgi:hypothetical protein
VIFLTILGITLNQPSEATLLKFLLKQDSKHSIVSGRSIKEQSLLPKQKPKLK